MSLTTVKKIIQEGALANAPLAAIASACAKTPMHFFRAELTDAASLALQNSLKKLGSQLKHVKKRTTDAAVAAKCDVCEDFFARALQRPAGPETFREALFALQPPDWMYEIFDQPLESSTLNDEMFGFIEAAEDGVAAAFADAVAEFEGRALRGAPKSGPLKRAHAAMLYSAWMCAEHKKWKIRTEEDAKALCAGIEALGGGGDGALLAGAAARAVALSASVTEDNLQHWLEHWKTAPKPAKVGATVRCARKTRAPHASTPVFRECVGDLAEGATVKELLCKFPLNVVQRCFVDSLIHS